MREHLRLAVITWITAYALALQLQTPTKPASATGAIAYNGVVTPTSAAATAFARDGALYSHNFLEPYDFDAVRREVRRLRGKMKKEKDSIAVNRHGCCLDGGSIAHECLTSERTARRLNALLGDGPLRPGDYPIEARVYKRGGEMEWHRDDVLYAEPQVELVLTLENDSDSQTQWVDAAGTLHAEWTEPNCLLCVRAGAGGALHRVTPAKRGERTILKAVYTTTLERGDPSAWAHLESFPMSRSRREKRRRR